MQYNIIGNYLLSSCLLLYTFQSFRDYFESSSNIQCSVSRSVKLREACTATGRGRLANWAVFFWFGKDHIADFHQIFGAFQILTSFIGFGYKLPLVI